MAQGIFEEIGEIFNNAFGQYPSEVLKNESSKRFDNYKFRCHSLGKIVTPSGKLTETSKTYLRQLFFEEIENTRKQISSKYFEKGLFDEQSGITLLNKTLYKGKLLVKNKERKSNDYIIGECDLVAPDEIVYDVKNAWDIFTFQNAQLTHEYTIQLVGYMWLWDKTKARLFYCLNNTPEHLIIQEEKKLFYSGNYLTMEDETYINDCIELRKQHNYDNKPLEERFKVFEVNAETLPIDKIISCINAARKFLNELDEERNRMIQVNRELMGIQPSFLDSPIPEGILIEKI